MRKGEFCTKAAAADVCDGSIIIAAAAAVVVSIFCVLCCCRSERRGGYVNQRKFWCTNGFRPTKITP